MVGQERLELSTSRLSSACSNQLSYWPKSIILAVRKLREEIRRQRFVLPHHGRIMQSAFRKEVIQPQVPLRLPCYDLVPVTDPTVVGCFLAVSAPASGGTNSHHLTGGVYKTRERIHRGVLIHDY